MGDEFSTYTNIFEPRTVIERVESDSSQASSTADPVGADLATCVVTDIRQLSATTSTCDKNDGPTCGEGYVDNGEMKLQDGTDDNRRVTMSSTTEASHNAALMDSREVEIGDRIRFTKPNTGTDSLAEVWETRTVDSVTYSVALDVTGSNTYSLFDGMVHQFTVTGHSRQAMRHKLCTMMGLARWSRRSAQVVAYATRALVSVPALQDTLMLTVLFRMHFPSKIFGPSLDDACVKNLTETLLTKNKSTKNCQRQREPDVEQI